MVFTSVLEIPLSTPDALIVATPKYQVPGARSLMTQV